MPERKPSRPSCARVCRPNPSQLQRCITAGISDEARRFFVFSLSGGWACSFWSPIYPFTDGISADFGYNGWVTSFKEARIILSNFHSHTTRCNHAVGSDESYVQAAIAAGFDQLGFSDHAPWPFADGQVSGMRMRLDQYPDYLQSIRDLREKYKDQIEIFLGLEMEYYPEHLGWLQAQRQEQGLDFLILGSHYDSAKEDLYFGGLTQKSDLARYARHTIKGMESGAFCCLAHPDLFMLSYPRFDASCKSISRDICQAAKALNLPLEYNLAGLYPNPWRQGLGYPTPQFWQIAAQEGITAVIGLDAHDPARYADSQVFENAVNYLKQLGIPRLHSLLPGKRSRQAV